MKRFYSLFLMAFWAFFVLQAEVVTFDFSTADGITAMGYAVPEPSTGTNLVQAGPKTVNGVTLSATDGATETRIWNSQGNFSLRIYVDGSITLSVAEGSITGITINAANTTNFDLLANVGDYTVTGGVGTWTGSESSVSFTHVGTKNAQIASIVVNTSGEGPVGPEDPIDPNITKLDSLSHLESLEDGTAFQFTSDVYVNYQWNEFLWVMQLDDEGDAYAGLIYGDMGKQYPLGAVIPAGWTGVKTTYKGLVEIGEPAHFANAINILDEYYYSAFDCTGYLSYVADPEEGWMNYKVSFDGVHLSREHNNGTFTISCNETDEEGQTYEATMTGFNKFGLNYSLVDSNELYSIEGMVTIYNGIMELYPITITEDPGTRLWKVLYEGEDGAQYKLNDTLYVAAASKADDGMLVYVTDNVEEIYYDTYAEWGYAEWMPWYPDWIALDCSGDEELFNTVVSLNVIAPGTVKGTLVDQTTNPRFVLTCAPAPLAAADFPTLTVFDYDLSMDYLGARGNELGRADGYFHVVDGVPCLCSDNDSVVVRLCFDYTPSLEAQMSDGCWYSILSIFKLVEEWTYDPVSRMRRIAATDEDYFKNYLIYPLKVVATGSVDEMIGSKQPVDVRYISPAGIESSEPHDGLNIIVTTYGDGSTTAVKRVVK
jgi:hypothetical protein